MILKLCCTFVKNEHHFNAPPHHRILLDIDKGDGAFGYINYKLHSIVPLITEK